MKENTTLRVLIFIGLKIFELIIIPAIIIFVPYYVGLHTYKFAFIVDQPELIPCFGFWFIGIANLFILIVGLFCLIPISKFISWFVKNNWKLAGKYEKKLRS